MFRKIRNVVVWMQGLIALDRQDNEKFLERVEQLDNGFVSTPYQRALVATSMLIVGRFDDARTEFTRVLVETRSSRDESNIYISHYCEARLAGMAGDLELVNLMAVKAAGLSCKQLYRDRLPVS